MPRLVPLRADCQWKKKVLGGSVKDLQTNNGEVGSAYCPACDEEHTFTECVPAFE